jgi:hypothetical protein
MEQEGGSAGGRGAQDFDTDRREFKPLQRDHRFCVLDFASAEPSERGVDGQAEDADVLALVRDPSRVRRIRAQRDPAVEDVDALRRAAGTEIDSGDRDQGLHFVAGFLPRLAAGAGLAGLILLEHPSRDLRQPARPPRDGRGAELLAK